MCLSPDEMKSSEVEQLIAVVEDDIQRYGEDEWNTHRLAELTKILDDRRANGTYDMVPKVTPRHMR